MRRTSRTLAAAFLAVAPNGAGVDEILAEIEAAWESRSTRTAGGKS
jgi:hypothetical protein